MLPNIAGEFGVVADPELKFSDKGNAWMRIRGVAKDRVRDSNGQWADGAPLFLDIILMGKSAENLVESVGKGDTIVVTGRLESAEWTDKEGNTQKSMRIRAEEIGVSVRWHPAKTPRLMDNSATAALSTLGAEEIAPPF